MVNKQVFEFERRVDETSGRRLLPEWIPVDPVRCFWTLAVRSGSRRRLQQTCCSSTLTDRNVSWVNDWFDCSLSLWFNSAFKFLFSSRQRDGGACWQQQPLDHLPDLHPAPTLHLDPGSLKMVFYRSTRLFTEFYCPIVFVWRATSHMFKKISGVLMQAELHTAQ